MHTKDIKEMGIHNGSDISETGFSVDGDPKADFPAVIRRPRHAGVKISSVNQDLYVGDDAQAKRGVLSLKYPVKHEIVTSLDFVPPGHRNPDKSLFISGGFIFQCTLRCELDMSIYSSFHFSFENAKTKNTQIKPTVSDNDKIFYEERKRLNHTDDFGESNTKRTEYANQNLLPNCANVNPKKRKRDTHDFVELMSKRKKYQNKRRRKLKLRNLKVHFNSKEKNTQIKPTVSDNDRIFDEERKRLNHTFNAFAAETKDGIEERRIKAMTRAEEIKKLLDPSIAKLRLETTETGLCFGFLKAIEKYDQNFIKLYTDGSFKLNKSSGCAIAVPHRSEVICIKTESESCIQAEYEGLLRALEKTKFRIRTVIEPHVKCDEAVVIV
ncbi:hypothetical protein QYM36_007780 [Artemia franciscana]|uniref:Uncharacterized protein n=1 Tax=Artemia franciscana TaxID=6661 RepID=A0AA88IEU5_ARTSF|nr:hypothetical protein QYM36_007780 [Artemia franciscana]